MSDEYYCCLKCQDSAFNVIGRRGKTIMKCVSCDEELDL